MMPSCVLHKVYTKGTPVYYVMQQLPIFIHLLLHML